MLEINILTSLLLVSMFVILFFRKENSLPNKILGLVFLTPALNYTNNIVILTEAIYSFPWTYFFVQITAALFAPLSYYYIILMTGTPFPRSFKWLRSVSALIILGGLFIAVRFAFLDQAGQTAYLHGVLNGPYPEDMLIYSGFVFVHQLLYFTTNAIQVVRYRNEMMQQVSDLTSVKLQYLFRFVILLWLLTLITVIFYAVVDTVYVEYIFLPLVLIVILLFILYYAFNQHAIFSSAEYAVHLGKVAQMPVGKNEEDVVENKEPDSLYSEMLTLIETEELYKKSDINIEQIGNRMGTPVYKLTNSIKANGTTFYEEMRKMRVQKAKELLADENCHYTIEGIAYEVGFSSRASFYRAFRKYEGIDPSSINKVE